MKKAFFNKKALLFLSIYIIYRNFLYNLLYSLYKLFFFVLYYNIRIQLLSAIPFIYLYKIKIKKGLERDISNQNRKKNKEYLFKFFFSKRPFLISTAWSGQYPAGPSFFIPMYCRIIDKMIYLDLIWKPKREMLVLVLLLYSNNN